MERRMRWKSHVRCEVGENPEIISKGYLSLFRSIIIRSEKDILKLVNTIIANTKGEGEKSTEDFWVKAERLLYSALIGYIWYEAPEEEQNFSTLLEFINASETREDDEEFKKCSGWIVWRAWKQKIQNTLQ